MIINPELSEEGIRKVGLLIAKAYELGMNPANYGSADESNTGNAHLKLEGYKFTLYIGKLDDTIYATFVNIKTLTSHTIDVTGLSLWDLEEWTDLN